MLSLLLLFKKINNLDELINMPTKVEEWSMIQISFRLHDPNIKTGTMVPTFTADPPYTVF